VLGYSLPFVACKTHISLRKKKNHWLTVKAYKNFFQANGSSKQVRVAISMSDKVDFRLISVRRDNEGHFILLKGTIHQEVTILNIYVPNISVPNYIKKPPMDLKAQINLNAVIVGDLNTPLSPVYRSYTQKNQQRSRINRHFRPSRHNRHLQTISCNHQTIHILFSSSWNFLKNRLYFRTQCKS
jgi:hypothetical protein